MKPQDCVKSLLALRVSACGRRSIFYRVSVDAAGGQLDPKSPSGSPGRGLSRFENDTAPLRVVVAPLVVCFCALARELSRENSGIVSSVFSRHEC